MQLGATLIRVACDQAARGSFVNALGGLPPVLPRAGSVRLACAIFLGDPAVPANLVTDLGNLAGAHCAVRAGRADGALIFEGVVPAAGFHTGLTFAQWTDGTAAHFEFALAPTDTNVPAGPLHLAVGVTTAGGDSIPLAYCANATLRDYGLFHPDAPIPRDYTSWSKAEADARYARAGTVSLFAPTITGVGSGAADSLETLPTAALVPPLLRTIYTGGELQDWLLVAGTDPTDPLHQRPSDFNESGNAKVWTRLR